MKKLYTKAELKKQLEEGKSLDQLLEFKDGQECLIFRADDFYPGEAVIYIPDVDLNEIDIYDINLNAEEIEKYLSYCYTGDYFLKICNGDLKMAERTFWFCDWQHPETGYEDLKICDKSYEDEETESPCIGCAYFDACGDEERTEPCDGRRGI